MKKVYIAPSVEVAELELAAMLAASDFHVSEDVTDDDAVMSNNRRGSWGNLWDTDK